MRLRRNVAMRLNVKRKTQLRIHGWGIEVIDPLETVWGENLSTAAGAQSATPKLAEFSSAEDAITIIKEPLVAKMLALKRAVFYSAGSENCNIEHLYIYSHRPL